MVLCARERGDMAKISTRFALTTLFALFAAVQMLSNVSLLELVYVKRYGSSQKLSTVSTPPLTAISPAASDAPVPPLRADIISPAAAASAHDAQHRRLPALGEVRIYIVDLSGILGNNSATEVLSRLAHRGHNATTRTIAHVISSDYAAQKPRTNVSTAPSGSMKCDYHDDTCSLRAYMHEEVILSQLAESSHVTPDPATADFLLVPVPATLLYFYLRDVSRHKCPECERLESRISHHLSGGGAGDEVARRWRACGGNEFVFMSLRCPDAHGKPMNNRGWESMFGPFKEPVRGVHICLEPSEQQRIPYARRARLRRQLMSEPASSMAYHTLIAPFYEWDATLTRADQRQVQGGRTLGESATSGGGGATRGNGAVLSGAEANELRVSRNTSVYFKGSAINGLRSNLLGAMQPRKCKTCVGRTLAYSRFVVTGNAEHVAAMGRARYCVAPRGEAASAKRIFDSVASGCIPVILADEYLWPFAGPLGGQLTPSNFSLHVGERDAMRNASRLVNLLERVSERQTRALQMGLAATWQRFRYGEHYTRGEALDGIIAELTHRREALLDAGCPATRSQPPPLSSSASASFSSSASVARSAQPPTWQPSAGEAEHARLASALTNRVRAVFDARLNEASKANARAGTSGEALSAPMSLDQLEVWSNQGGVAF